MQESKSNTNFSNEDYITLDITTKPSGTTFYTNDLISYQISGNLSNKLSIYVSAPTYSSNDKYKIIIVENNGVRKTFLDDLGCEVYYTNNNFLKLRKYEKLHRSWMQTIQPKRNIETNLFYQSTLTLMLGNEQ